MISAANRVSYSPAPDASNVVVLRVGEPCFHGLRDSYHDLRRALRRVEMRRDPVSLGRARKLDKARLILLDALVDHR